MIASMTLAEIQAKYADVHTPEEVAQFQENMTNSKKWKIVKNEWTWDGLNHVQLRGRALQYHPSLDMLELYQEHAVVHAGVFDLHPSRGRDQRSS